MRNQARSAQKAGGFKDLPKRPPVSLKSLGRVIVMLRDAYPVLVPLSASCIVFSSITNALPAVFQQKIIADIQT